MSTQLTRFTSYFLPLLAAVFAPIAMVNAQGTPEFGYFDNALGQVVTLVEQLVPLVIALGLLFFIWGLVQFIVASGDEESKESGKRKIVWGVIALFVIVSVWGLVGLLGELSGVEQGTGFTLPETGL